MLLWCDNFGAYGTQDGFLRMRDGPYAEANNFIGPTGPVADPDPLGDGKSVMPFTGDQNGLRKVLPGNRATVGTCFRMYLPALPGGSSGARFLEFRDEQNRPQVSMIVMSTGAVRLVLGENYNALLAVSEPILTANAWNHVEIRVKVDSLNGAVEARVNGVTVCAADGLNTKDTLVSGVAQLQWRSAGSFGYMKDLVIWDDLGDRNNDFFGTVSVARLVPDEDIALPWGLVGAPSGYEALDNSPPLDGQYISAGTPPPAPAVFGLTNLPQDITSVRGLVAMTRMRKTDGGDGNVQMSLSRDGQAVSGADRPITTAFTYWWDVFETDPITGNAWSPPDVDKARIGIKRTI